MGFMMRFFCTLLLSLACICVHAAPVEENFILVNGATNKVVMQMGPHVEQCVTPASTFKIALCLMGFDTQILQDDQNPCWSYSEGYANTLESWKAPHTPRLWMKNSCFWYSQLLASRMGYEKVCHYLQAFNYGNCDMSGGITGAWVSSTLKISPRQQVTFIRDMLRGKLPASPEAIEKTRNIILVEEMPNGWKLYGKTGLGTICQRDGRSCQVGWFVGWVEKEGDFFPFAYHIREATVNTGKRIPRVKQLIDKSRIMAVAEDSLASTK
jgi:beta-lactamase class D